MFSKLGSHACIFMVYDHVRRYTRYALLYYQTENILIVVRTIRKKCKYLTSWEQWLKQCKIMTFQNTYSLEKITTWTTVQNMTRRRKFTNTYTFIASIITSILKFNTLFCLVFFRFTATKLVYCHFHVYCHNTCESW